MFISITHSWVDTAQGPGSSTRPHSFKQVSLGVVGIAAAAPVGRELGRRGKLGGSSSSRTIPWRWGDEAFIIRTALLQPLGFQQRLLPLVVPVGRLGEFLIPLILPGKGKKFRAARRTMFTLWVFIHTIIWMIVWMSAYYYIILLLIAPWFSASS